MITWLEGKKTYIVGAIMALLNFICVMDWFCFTSQQLIALDGFLAAVALVALRAGVAKAEQPKSDETVTP